MGIYYAEEHRWWREHGYCLDTISGTLRFRSWNIAGVAGSSSLDATACLKGTALPHSGNAFPSLSGDLLLGAIVTSQSRDL